VFQTLVLLGALACSVYLYTARPDQKWYAARAVAESIKTVTWRFITRAEPFGGTVETDLNQFRNTLRSILKQNKEVAARATQYLNEPQITDSMLELRQRSATDRLAYYVDHRISEQRLWYAKKAKANERLSKMFFVLLMITNAVLVCLSLLRISYPEWPFWPTEALIAIAAALLSWMQSKKFSELSAAYALAAQEIGIVKEQSASVKTDSELSAFVGDSENAFSREHTQWIARKDT
jgi:SMODS and SLOG-associating 2TM effector domain 1/SMODS and SLOG-associating 2TM effector domain 3